MTNKQPTATSQPGEVRSSEWLGLEPERAAFERWTHSEGGNLSRHADDPQRYASATVQGRWRAWSAAVAAERERWQRIATNAQAVTTGCEDKIDHFEVPSHLMAALALALDEGPNE